MFFCDAILGSKAEIRTDVEQNLVAFIMQACCYLHVGHVACTPDERLPLHMLLGQLPGEIVQ